MRPHLVRWQEDYADQGFLVIEITGGEEEPLEVMKPIVEKQELNHPVLWDRNCRNHRNYGLKNWPVAYLVDAHGRVFWEGNPAQVVNRPKAGAKLRELVEEKLRETIALRTPATNKFRPKYVAALDAARWNFWWYIAAAIPFIFLIPAAVCQRFGCFAFPSAIVGCWLAFAGAVGHYWETKVRVAATAAERADVTADTGLLFGPVVVGVPLVTVYVLLVGLLVYGIVAIARRTYRRPSVS